MTRAEVAAALIGMKAQIDAIRLRAKKDTTAPTVPAIKATGGAKLVNVALTVPSTDAGGL